MKSDMNLAEAIQPEKHPGKTSAIIMSVMAGLFMIPGICLLVAGELAGIILLFAGLILLACIPAEIKKARYLNVIKERRCAMFSPDELFSLQRELDHTQPTYGSLYMLNEYLYIPQHGVLLRYTEIQGIRAVEHKKNLITQGVTLFFRCPDMELDVIIPEWRKYLKERYYFESRLNQKRSESLKVQPEKEHQISMPSLPM